MLRDETTDQSEVTALPAGYISAFYWPEKNPWNFPDAEQHSTRFDVHLNVGHANLVPVSGEGEGGVHQPRSSLK